MQTTQTLAEIRAWIPIEPGDRPTLNGRIPCLAGGAPAAVFAWAFSMEDHGMTFHPDDDPASIVVGLDGPRLFVDAEVPLVRSQIEAVRELGEDLMYLAIDVASGMITHRLADEIKAAGWAVTLGQPGTLIFSRKDAADPSTPWRVGTQLDAFNGTQLPAMHEDLAYALDAFAKIEALFGRTRQPNRQG